MVSTTDGGRGHSVRGKGWGKRTRSHQQLTSEGQGQFTPEGAIGHVDVDAQTSTLFQHGPSSAGERPPHGMANYLVGTNALKDTLEGFQTATEVISPLRTGEVGLANGHQLLGWGLTKDVVQAI